MKSIPEEVARLLAARCCFCEMVNNGGYYLDIFITVKVEALQESASRQQQRTTYYLLLYRDQRSEGQIG